MEPSIAAVGAGAWGKNIVRTLHQMGALHSIVEPSPALRAELEHFSDCINSRATPRSCGRNGLDVIRVLERAAAPVA